MTDRADVTGRKRVVIVGAGFGGLPCARRIAGHGLEIVLVDRNAYTLFQPLLYQVATGAISGQQVADPITTALTDHDVRFVQCEVQGVDLDGRAISTDAGPIAYDYLVLATGSVPTFFGNENVHRASFPLKSLQDAWNLRDHLVQVLEEAVHEPDDDRRAELLTVLVVGGGPIGVECAGAIAELAQHVIPRQYHDLRPADVSVHLYEGGPSIMAGYPEKLQRYAVKRLGRLGVQVHTGQRVADASENGVVLQDGTEVAGHTLVWGTGTVAAPLADAVDTPKAHGGLVQVGDDFSLPGHPEVFAIGDMAAYQWQGQPLPGMAQPAIQGGEYVATLILSREGGHAVKPFSYWDKGTMAVIGRGKAIASIPLPQPFRADEHPGGPHRTLDLDGFSAWSAWLGLHLTFLRGFKNRAITALDWSYDYVLDGKTPFDQAIRSGEERATQGD